MNPAPPTRRDGTPRIAAVFATMDRAATAEACLRALAAQSRPPEWVVVADNGSTDATPERLESLTDLPFRSIIHRMPENRGNAGGVETAMEIAFAHGADAVWILDDDSWPQPAALEALLIGDWDRMVVRHSLQIDPRSGRFTWPLQVLGPDGGFHLVGAIEDLPPGDTVRSRITWTGALVSREVRELVGPVNGELFIRGEDEEYPWRFERLGCTQEAVKASRLDHPGPHDIVRWSLCGRKLFLEPGLSDWKLYYKVRNMVWLKRQQSGGTAALAMALAYAVGISAIDGMQRLPLLAEAVGDGWRGRLGRWSRHPAAPSPTATFSGSTQAMD